MLGLDWRAARAAWTVLLIAGLVALAFVIRHTLLILICALLFAYLLSPLVDLVDRFSAKRIPRNLSLAVVYLLLLAALATGMGFIGARIAQEGALLASRLPQYLDNPETLASWPLPVWLEPYREEALSTLRGQLEANAKELVPMLRKAAQQVMSVLGNLVFVLLVPILSFFFLKDSASIRSTFLDQFLQERQRRLVKDIMQDAHVLLAQFIRALVVLCFITFLAYWLFLGTMKVPYALLLAVGAGIVEFIPVAGPLAASLAILVVAGFAGYEHIIWIVVFLVAYRLVQDYLIWPYLLGAGVKLPPAAVILGVVAGAQVGGMMGMFLSVPAIAVLRVVYVRIRKAQEGPVPDIAEP